MSAQSCSVCEMFFCQYFSLWLGWGFLFAHQLWPLAGGTSLKHLQEKPHYYHIPGPGMLVQAYQGSLGEGEGQGE